MRALSIVTAVLCLVGLAAHPAAQLGAPRQLTLDEYLEQLDRLAVAVDQLDERQPAKAEELFIRLPRTWTVVSGDQRFEIRTEWLVLSLAEWQKQPTPAARRELARRMRDIRADAARYADPRVTSSIERDRLNQILSAAEFRDVSGPSWLDRLRQRAADLLVRFLSRLLGSSAVPTITNFLVYAAIGVVVILIAMWMYRSLGRSAAMDAIRPDRIPAVARPWNAWLDDARAAAARGEWSDAIHLAYWCGISFLETQGAWRPDRSRTPREYLRAMKTEHEQRSTLQTMTRTLEQVWYGTGEADAAAFDDVLAQLKKLGCPSI